MSTINTENTISLTSIPYRLRLKSQCLILVVVVALESLWTLSRDNFWCAESGSKVKSLVSFVCGIMIRAKSVKSETFFSRRARRRIDIVVFGRRFLISRKFSLTWVLTSFGRPDWWRIEYSTSYLIFGQPWFSHRIVTLNVFWTGSRLEDDRRGVPQMEN